MFLLVVEECEPTSDGYAYGEETVYKDNPEERGELSSELLLFVVVKIHSFGAQRYPQYATELNDSRSSMVGIKIIRSIAKFRYLVSLRFYSLITTLNLYKSNLKCVLAFHF